MRRAVTGLIVLGLLGACAGDEIAADPADVPEVVSAEEEVATAEEEAVFTVGFAARDLAWRAGAKPGQVGTEALPAREEAFARGATEVLPIVLEHQADPQALLPAVTAWVLGRLEQLTASAEPGRYARLFEAGRGIADAPQVRAVVLGLGDARVAVVRADTYLMHEQLHRRVAELVGPETGIGPDALLLVSSHNHSAPHALSPSAGVWTLADAFDPRHFVYVAHRIAEAIVEADRSREPALLRVARTELRDVQRNIIGPDEVKLPPPGGGPPEPVTVGYPRDHFDPDLVVLRFDAAGEPARTLAFLFVLGMHPESLPQGHGLTSGEWPRAVERKLLASAGAPAVWLPGALGDVEPDNGALDPAHDFWREGFEAMETMSGLIASAVKAAFDEAGATPGDPMPALSAVARHVPGPQDSPLPTSAYLGGLRLPSVRFVQDEATIHLQVVRVGDVWLLAIPGEPTSDLSLHLKSRVDREAGNLYQGYVWPDAAEWVRERIGGNFSTAELTPDEGAAIPVVISQANAYIGYIVTRWEYENRDHYRQSMTAFGPGTAEHLAAHLAGLVRQIGGGEPLPVETPAWQAADLEGVEAIAELLAGLDERVAEMSASLPATDGQGVGVVLQQPVAAELPVLFSWVGGTNDLEPPVVLVEHETPAGWEPIPAGSASELVLLFEPPDRWSARWSPPPAMPGDTGNHRFRVAGHYRGTEAGAAEPDPLWDPDGANVPYAVISEPFDPPQP